MKLKYLLIGLVLVFGNAAEAGAQGLSQAEALRLAFGSALVERKTAYLDDAMLARAKSLAGAGVDVTQRVVTYYRGVRGGTVTGIAYFDTHRVRTLSEVLMVVVGPGGEVQRIEVLRFAEPQEYKASERWLDQFENKTLTPALSVKRDIVNMTGATLTSTAVTRAARRVLALHEVIQPFGREK